MTVTDLLIGTSSFGQDERAFPVYDAFWAAGGRAFDTAWIYGYAYGPGCCEEVFGRWADSRGVTDDVVVLAKGAHTPQCRPEAVASQLDESLDRMRRSTVDLYMMHRDDPQVPVGELVDAMVTLMRKGIAGGYGFSNWTLARVREAASYAARNDLPAPAGVSNQLSLIRMVQPIHPGTVAIDLLPWQEWLSGNGCDLYPWASQGRGAHALTDPADLRTGPLGPNWYSEENVARLRRSHELAARRGLSSTAVALAWVRSQPFRVRPIIGPRSPAEVHDSLAAADLTLTPEERDWLEHG